MTSANSWFGMGPPPRYVATRHAGGQHDTSAREWAQLGRRWGYGAAKDTRGQRNSVVEAPRMAPPATRAPGARSQLGLVAGSREEAMRAVLSAPLPQGTARQRNTVAGSREDATRSALPATIGPHDLASESRDGAAHTAAPLVLVGSEQ